LAIDGWQVMAEMVQCMCVYSALEATLTFIL
jgi:hypothetical protein